MPSGRRESASGPGAGGTDRRCSLQRACFPRAREPCGVLWKVPFREAALHVAKDQGTESCRPPNSAHRRRPATWNPAAHTATATGLARCPRRLHSRALEDTSSPPAAPPRGVVLEQTANRSRGRLVTWPPRRTGSSVFRLGAPPGAVKSRWHPLHPATLHSFLARAPQRACPLFGPAPQRAASWKGGCEVQ